MFNSLVYFASKGHGLFRVKPIDLCVELVLRAVNKLKVFGDWASFSRNYISSYESFPASQKFIEDPERFLESMAIVLRSPDKDRKGTILVAYNYAFPTFALIYDLPKIMERYHIVLEPSTARYLMPEILMFKGFAERVFIETGEPKDAEFLERFFPEASSVPIAANWWIDSRIFNNKLQEEKKYDLIMVSSWLKLKRHGLLFDALKKLRDRGRDLKCVLVGYPIDLTKDDIVKSAADHGVEDLIEIYEWISQEKISQLYQQSRLNLLLSKREGFNRSVIEGLYCDVPCLIRDGFNFGDKYDYINHRTGGYFVDEKLDMAIEDALENIDQFKPVQWIKDNGMTAKNAALVLEEKIYGTAKGLLAVKTSGLDGMEYWNSEDLEKYSDDYRFLLNEACRYPLKKKSAA